jgi:hypothetical protein
MNMKMNKKNLEMKIKIMIKRRAMIKGKIRMMGVMKDQGQNHHNQECTKPFKEITSWITFLMISKRGKPLDHVLLLFVNITRLSLL